MKPAEQAIYDTFEKDSRAVLDAARAAATAIGSDINAIIGQVDKVAVKSERWIVKATRSAWEWLESFFQFLDGPNHKFSHKRLLALAFGVVSLRQFIIGDRFAGILTAAVTVVLAVISAVTKT